MVHIKKKNLKKKRIQRTTGLQRSLYKDSWCSGLAKYIPVAYLIQ